jgi:hypothetical protein
MRKLILFLLICISAKVNAQVYQEMPQYGYRANRMAFDSTLQIPTVCGVPTLKSVVKANKNGAIAFDSCNNKLYQYNPKTLTWSEVSGGTTPNLQQVLDVNATAYNRNLTLIDSGNGFANRTTIQFDLQRFGADNYMTINDANNIRVAKYSNQYARISSNQINKGIQMGWDIFSGDNFMSIAFTDKDFLGWHKIKSNSGFGTTLTTTIPAVTGTLAMSVNNQTADANGNITISTSSDTTSLSNRINLKQNSALTSYSFIANNTPSTANAEALPFKDTSGVYTGSPTWNGTAPTASSHTYRWTRIGKMVTLNISLVYSIPGVANSTLNIPLPADCPTPIVPTGLTGNSTFMYPVNFKIFASFTALASLQERVSLRKNSTGTGYEINAAFGGSAAVGALVTLTYYTN